MKNAIEWAVVQLRSWSPDTETPGELAERVASGLEAVVRPQARPPAHDPAGAPVTHLAPVPVGMKVAIRRSHAEGEACYELVGVVTGVRYAYATRPHPLLRVARRMDCECACHFDLAELEQDRHGRVLR